MNEEEYNLLIVVLEEAIRNRRYAAARMCDYPGTAATFTEAADRLAIIKQKFEKAWREWDKGPETEEPTTQCAGCDVCRD